MMADGASQEGLRLVAAQNEYAAAMDARAAAMKEDKVAALNAAAEGPSRNAKRVTPAKRVPPRSFQGVLRDASIIGSRYKLAPKPPLPPLSLFEARPVGNIRAQVPGWDPRQHASMLLDLDAKKFTDLRVEHSKKKKTRKIVKERACTLLQRPGPTAVTPADYVKHHAKAEGLTMAEWVKEQDTKGEQDLERKRLVLIAGQKRAVQEAKDPRPPEFEYLNAEAQLVRKRLGGDAVAVMDKLKDSTDPLHRRLRSAATCQLMVGLRLIGYGVVEPEQVRLERPNRKRRCHAA
ncbi:hypothetical protein M885DRAFT_74253 [Pelagophyceae sp. CCMP2097]|nr:hypothetical protein M885DRAFT_74253 [Pelagophyceae sp. CCMP2097]